MTMRKNRKNEKTPNKGNLFSKTVSTLSPRTRKILIFVACFVIAVVCCLIEGSGAFRAIDYYVEDSLFQNKRDADKDIIVIGLTDDDYEDINISSSYSKPEFISALIDKLNSLPVAPAVIGIDEFVMSPTELDACAKSIHADNVVLSYNAQIEDGIIADINYKDTLSLHSDSPVGNTCDDILIGHSNILYDSDGIARRAINVITDDDGNSGRSFAYQVYLKYCEEKDIVPSGSDNLKNRNVSLISFTSAPGDYYCYSISDILNDNFVGADLANKIILIGSYTNNIRNGYHTAVERDGSMFNVEYQANIIENLKNDCLLKEIPMWIQLLCLFIVILIYTMILGNAKLLWGFLSFVAILVLDIIASFVCFRFLFVAVHPLFYVITLPCLIFVLIFKLHKTSTENAAVVTSMNKYMDPSVFSNIINNSDIVSNHEIRENAAVIFVDIRGFTEILTTNDKSTVAALLDKYYEIAYNCITAYEGVIDKYIGDGVMGYWLDSEKNGSDIVEKACLAALKIQNELVSNGGLFTDYIGKPIRVGIGLDYGEILFGSVGGNSRMDYTIVGSTVNRASKIESIAEAGMIYISDTVAELLGDYASIDPLNIQQSFRGFDSAFQIYSLKSMRKAIWTEEEKPTKSENNISLYVLGSRGSRPVDGIDFSEFGGQTSCYIIKNENHALVIDCGTGLYDAGHILSSCTRIDVCLTHIHYDHILGLLDWSVFPSDAEVTFYADFAHYYGAKTFERFFEVPFWPATPKLGQMIDISKRPGLIPLGDDMSVTFYPADHPNSSHLMIIQVLDKKVVVLADCETTIGIPISSMQFSDCIIFDGMFTDEEYGHTIGWGHSTWEQGCKLGAIAKPKTLLITHHDSHRSDKDLRDFERKAKRIFPNTIFARAGQIINL